MCACAAAPGRNTALRCSARQDCYLLGFTIRCRAQCLRSCVCSSGVTVTCNADSLARYVVLMYAAACAAALNGIAVWMALRYAAVPSAGAGAPATTMCDTLVYAYVCGTGADAAVGLVIILCYALSRRAALVFCGPCKRSCAWQPC